MLGIEWQDALNGAIELVGAGTVLMSAHRVGKDGGAKGIHVSHIGYGLFVNWWSVYYYHHVAQPVSFYCGVVFALALSRWAWLIWKHHGDNDGTG